LCVVVLVALLASSASALVIRVKWDSATATPGTNWNNAFHTITAAMNVAKSGDQIWVARGTYSGNIMLKSGVVLYGGFAGVETQLSQRPSFPRPGLDANEVKIYGSGYGNAVEVASSAIKTTLIDGFSISNGDYGVYCNSSSLATISNNKIYGNNSYGIYGDRQSSPFITRNTITGNVVIGIYSTRATATITNNIVTGNGWIGIASGDTDASSIINNTITNNTKYGITCGSAKPSIINNIIAFNGSGIFNFQSSGTPTLNNNCLYNPAGVNYVGQAVGSGDISLNPGFVSTAYGRLHIQPDSPCVNAGLNSAVLTGWVDFDSQNRIQNGTVDIGADESDGTLWSEYQPAIIYVSPNGQDQNDGSSWQLAKKTIQTGVDAAAGTGGEVWVAAGTYTEHVVLHRYVYLYGGFEGSETDRDERNWDVNKTIIDASGTGNVVNADTGFRMSTVSGFTIKNGSYGIYCYYASPFIENNMITGNAKSGIFDRQSSPPIENNIITGSGQYGIYCEQCASPITNNTITGSVLYGIYVYSSPVSIMNNIVAYNGKGIFSNDDTTVLSNNCVYNPSGVNYDGPKVGAGDISQDPGFVSVAYGMFHIQPNSPCVNAGLDGAVQDGWKDMDAQTRIQGAHVDMGADESDGTVWSTNPTVIHVSPNGSDANNGSTWALAKKTVQAGIDIAAGVGGEVWVSAGTFSEHIVLRERVNIYGGFAGIESARSGRDWVTNKSILDGNGSGNVVDGGSGFHMSTLDGFTVKNGLTGIRCSNSSPYIKNNNITSNGQFGVDCYNSSPVIANNLITGNGFIGISAQTGSPVITNNTITGNGRYGITCNETAPPITNNIVAYNGNGIYDNFTDLYVPVLKNNCVYNPGGTNYDNLTAGSTDISVDPVFVSVAYGRLHIQPTSPCVNAGLNSAVQSGWLDMDGQNRIQGTNVDIGADESDGTLWPNLPAVIMRVSPKGLDKNDGSSWNLAKKTVQAGIDAAFEAGGEVWVAAGTYNEHILLSRSVYVYGGFAGTETTRDQRNWATNKSILDGSSSGNVVGGSSGSRLSTLDGFTVRNGSTGIYCYYSSPYIENNTIMGNTQYGIYCTDASPAINNNVITGSGQYGIYCYYYSRPSITNNTISANELYGIYSDMDSLPSITNSIVAFNGNGLFGLVLPTRNNNCVYNPAGIDYDNLRPGTGDISVDPKFVSIKYGRFHIQPDSPCVNAGLNTAVQSGWKDMDGQSRIQGTNVDIGADESNGTVWSALPKVVRVSHAGSDTNNGSTWALAKKTVQAGIDAVSDDGGEVWVAAGAYTEHLQIRQYVNVYGGFAGTEIALSQRNWVANQSILDGNGSGNVVDGGRGYHVSRVDGFIIQNGACGIYTTASVDITNNKIKGMGTYGIYCESSSPSINNNWITGKSAYGIYCHISSPPITNNTISVTGGRGIFTGNSASSPYIKNNIIAFNLIGIDNYINNGNPYLLNNCVYNPGGTNYLSVFAGDDDVSADPMFADAETGDYHITYGSPCIDTGNDEVVDSSWTDIDGEARIQGPHVDMGADEIAIQKKYTLSSTVHLGDYTGTVEGIPVTVDLISEDGYDILRTEHTTLDDSGKFSIHDVLPGIYRVGIKPSHWLRKVTSPIEVIDADVDFVIR